MHVEKAKIQRLVRLDMCHKIEKHLRHHVTMNCCKYWDFVIDKQVKIKYHLENIVANISASIYEVRQLTQSEDALCKLRKKTFNWFHFRQEGQL